MLRLLPEKPGAGGAVILWTWCDLHISGRQTWHLLHSACWCIMQCRATAGSSFLWIGAASPFPCPSWMARRRLLCPPVCSMADQAAPLRHTVAEIYLSLCSIGHKLSSSSVTSNLSSTPLMKIAGWALSVASVFPSSAPENALKLCPVTVHRYYVKVC